MGLISALVAGALGAAAYKATRPRKGGARNPDPDNPLGYRKPPADAVFTGEKAVRRGQVPTAADKVDATNPPDAMKDESLNTLGASSAAVRVRRRARAGHAGRVTLPGGTGAGSGSTPRTLLGY